MLGISAFFTHVGLFTRWRSVCCPGYKVASSMKGREEEEEQRSELKNNLGLLCRPSRFHSGMSLDLPPCTTSEPLSVCPGDPGSAAAAVALLGTPFARAWPHPTRPLCSGTLFLRGPLPPGHPLSGAQHPCWPSSGFQEWLKKRRTGLSAAGSVSGWQQKGLWSQHTSPPLSTFSLSVPDPLCLGLLQTRQGIRLILETPSPLGPAEPMGEGSLISLAVSSESPQPRPHLEVL